MKSLTINLIGVYLAASIASCHYGTGRHVVIKTGDNYGETKIEYSGRADFNSDGTAITYISPKGFVKYSNGDQELIAESDYAGHITYQINDSQKLRQLNPQQKIFLAGAIKNMIRLGHNDD
ncbi:hypothetical protein [Mucilaginibacter sp. dw_454]|uniref:hypothetical protein n=1 Tax=Mucilaginibacter sp. dw_454 TaxID=2720079 RepID=UPI001BD62275|nr:hypothetical protein [Mucilaginibacter sp. dw_454]